MNTETRRKSERTKVASNEIVYLHFQTGNGGIVLDVSAEGLGFQAADPLQAGESLSFRLSLPGFPEIGLAGQIVWLDSTRKRGGMRLRVPPESAALFHQWQQRYLGSAAEAGTVLPSAEPDRRPVARKAASRMESNTEDRARPMAQPARSTETQFANSASVSQTESPRTSPPPPPNPFARRTDSMLGARGPIFVSEWEAPPEPPRTGRNILVACVIIGLCAAVAGGSYYLAGKRAVGNVLINLGQQIVGAKPEAGTTVPQPVNRESQPQPGTVAPGAPPAQPPQNAAVTNSAPTASAAPPASLPPQLPADAAATPNPAAAPQPTPSAAQRPNANAIPADADDSAAELRQNDPRSGNSDAPAPRPDVRPRPDSHSGAKRASQPPAAPADNGGEELNQALVYLGSSNSQDSAVAEALLWSAIGKGDAQADLVLGDLYMRGQGAVRRNCSQAEVLLHAALVADVPGANEKMGELQTYGCH